MYNGNVDYYQVFMSISDEGFQNLKFRMGYNKEFFVDPNENGLASGLFAYICDPYILKSLSIVKLSELVKILFSSDLLSVDRFEKYVDIIVSSLANLKLQDADSNVSRYYNCLVNELVPRFKKCLHQEKECNDVFLYLTDIFKTASCLIRSRKNNAPFVFVADKRSLSELFERIVGYHWEENERQEAIYYAFVSWILMEMIYDQDGIERGKE